MNRARIASGGVIGLEVYSLSLDAIGMRGARKHDGHELHLAREMTNVWGHNVRPDYIVNCRVLHDPKHTPHDGRNPDVQIPLVRHSAFNGIIRGLVRAMRSHGIDTFGHGVLLRFDATSSVCVFRVLCYCNSGRHRAVGVGQILRLATGCSARFNSPHMLRPSDFRASWQRYRCSCRGCTDGASPDMDHIVAAKEKLERELEAHDFLL